jgi:NAD(P)-dependent dehydrogenase (short-subunit alcohol dehydrogenase family)
MQRAGTKFDGKVVVITGAAGGMGRALAVDVCRRGASGLSLCDVNVKALEETVQLARAASPRVVLITASKVDVISKVEVESWRNTVVEAHKGAVDVIFKLVHQLQSHWTLNALTCVW